MVVVGAKDVDGGDFIVGEADAACTFPLEGNGFFFSFSVVGRVHCCYLLLLLLLNVWSFSVQTFVRENCNY